MNINSPRCVKVATQLQGGDRIRAVSIPGMRRKFNPEKGCTKKSHKRYERFQARTILFPKVNIEEPLRRPIKTHYQEKQQNDSRLLISFLSIKLKLQNLGRQFVFFLRETTHLEPGGLFIRPPWQFEHESCFKACNAPLQGKRGNVAAPDQELKNSRQVLHK